MRHQPPHDLDLLNLLPLILSRKAEPAKSHVETNLEKVIERADEAREAFIRLTTIPALNWPDVVGDALRSCYDLRTEALGLLKDELLEWLRLHSEVNLQRCPYCMLNEPNTWDHYLPKSDYPELAVYFGNLIFVCWGCNHKKGDHYRPDRLEYCHPGFTVDPIEPLLHCQVRITAGVIEIGFYCSSSDGDDERPRIAQRHAENLDLYRRYKLESASVFSAFVGALARDCPNGVTEEVFRAAVQRHFEDVAVDLGPNAWEARFWHGLLRCEGIVPYLNERVSLYSPRVRQGLLEVAPAIQ